jgi:hypothetical protein
MQLLKAQALHSPLTRIHAEVSKALILFKHNIPAIDGDADGNPKVDTRWATCSTNDLESETIVIQITIGRKKEKI